MSGEHENTGADDIADAERDQIDRGEAALEWNAAVGRAALVGLCGLSFEGCNTFSDPNLRHQIRSMAMVLMINDSGAHRSRASIAIPTI